MIYRTKERTLEFQKIESYVINNKQVNTLPKQKNKSILYFDFLTSVANRYAERSNKLYKSIAFLIYTDTLSLMKLYFYNILFC